MNQNIEFDESKTKFAHLLQSNYSNFIGSGSVHSIELQRPGCVACMMFQGDAPLAALKALTTFQTA